MERIAAKIIMEETDTIPMIFLNTMVKNTMSPMIGMKKQKKNPATETTDLCF